MVHTKTETLGDIIKKARARNKITVEDLAERVGVTDRYIYRIENGGKEPSLKILRKIVRELSITPDSIFYPEHATNDTEVEDLIRRLYNCDERSIEVVKATVKALIDSAPKNS